MVYAENGREGIEQLERNEDVALVLMDIMMPEMDGWATTSAIRRMPQFADQPIIALTAGVMRGDREKSIASGASDYVPKPVDVDRLLERLRGWLMRGRVSGSSGQGRLGSDGFHRRCVIDARPGEDPHGRRPRGEPHRA